MQRRNRRTASIFIIPVALWMVHKQLQSVPMARRWTAFDCSREVVACTLAAGAVLGAQRKDAHGASRLPVQMVDGVRVFGVGLGQFAGEYLRLLLEPSCPQGLDPIALRCGRCARCNAMVQRDLVRHVRPRLGVARRRRTLDESRLHRRRHEVELVRGRQTEDLLNRPSHVDLCVVGMVRGPF